MDGEDKSMVDKNVKTIWMHKDFFKLLKEDPLLSSDDYAEAADDIFWGTIEDLKRLPSIMDDPDNLDKWIPFFTMSD